jgi:hypothetical protein
VLIISAPIKNSKPDVRNVRRGISPWKKIVGDLTFLLIYLDISKTDPNRIKNPAIIFNTSTTNESIEKIICLDLELV